MVNVFVLVGTHKVERGLQTPRMHACTSSQKCVARGYNKWPYHSGPQCMQILHETKVTLQPATRTAVCLPRVPYAHIVSELSKSVQSQYDCHITLPFVLLPRSVSVAAVPRLHLVHPALGHPRPSFDMLRHRPSVGSISNVRARAAVQLDKSVSYAHTLL